MLALCCGAGNDMDRGFSRFPRQLHQATSNVTFQSSLAYPQNCQRAPGLNLPVTPGDHKGLEIKGQTSLTSKKKSSFEGRF